MTEGILIGIKWAVVVLLTSLVIRALLRLRTDGVQGIGPRTIHVFNSKQRVVFILISFFLFFLFGSGALSSFSSKGGPSSNPDFYFFLTTATITFLIGLLMVFYSHLYRVECDDATIAKRNFISKVTEMRWDSIARVSYSGFASAIVFHDRSGQKIYISIHLPGFSKVLSRVPKSVEGFAGVKQAHLSSSDAI